MCNLLDPLVLRHLYEYKLPYGHVSKLFIFRSPTPCLLDLPLNYIIQNFIMLKDLQATREYRLQTNEKICRITK